MREGPIKIPVVRDPASRDIPLPEPATEKSAGLDLRAASAEPLTIPPLGRALVATGLRIAIPQGYEGQVRPRSGLAVKHGVTILNAPGTIDSDYRGEIKVALVNLGQEPYTISRGDRVAQLVIAPVSRVSWQPVEELPPSRRGEAGFGHTGVR